jgi:quercetin dioxygenase-like cupin family protein
MGPYWLDRDEGEALWMFDVLDTIKASADQTGNSFTLVETINSGGTGPPLHVHDRFDRGLYVVEGEYTVVVGDKSIRARAGTWIFVPRSVPHTWRCDSSEGRILALLVRGGSDGFFREVGEPVTDRSQLPPGRVPDVERLSNVAAQYGMRFVGPPLGSAEPAD